MLRSGIARPCSNRGPSCFSYLYKAYRVCCKFQEVHISSRFGLASRRTVVLEGYRHSDIRVTVVQKMVMWIDMCRGFDFCWLRSVVFVVCSIWRTPVKTNLERFEHRSPKQESKWGITDED